jgi:predicted RND superfamily exporter protein
MREWAERLYDHRRGVASLILAATFFFAWQIKHLNVSSRFSDLAPRNHPYAQLREEYPGFGSPFTISVVIQKKTGTIYDPQTLRKIQEATRLVDLIPGVDHDGVISIASRKVKYVQAKIGGIEASNLLIGTIPQTAAAIAALRDKIRSTAGVIGSLVSFQEDAALIQATFIERLTDYNVVFRAVNDIIEKLGDGDHRLYTAGLPMLTGWIYHYQREMYLIFAVGLLAMGLFLVLHFRNICGVVAPLAVAVTSAVWGFGFAGALGHSATRCKCVNGTLRSTLRQERKKKPPLRR